MRHHSHRMTKLPQATSSALLILGLSFSPFSFQAVASAQEPPTKQFTRRNIPIAWILVGDVLRGKCQSRFVG